jgi:diaminohydroxyphosphoribosylaminopyrimidine deaminase / 5-amino-6-(5-phosphoribosylamino)uracil reductase
VTREIDEHYLRQAIALAKTGRGITEPNPSVACILVRDGRIIGQGRTQGPGKNHAEPEALANCTEDPRGATAYVTLEPCCHTNKRTPPCCPRLIGAGISRVVLGAIDPTPEVNGNGIKVLRAAGIDVTTGVLEKECNQLLAPFIATTRFKRPYVTLKWAQTADGKIAGPNGSRLQITDREANRIIHQLRARSDAILIGANTALNDNPLLTARNIDDSRLSRRIVLDSRLRLREDSALVRTAGEAAVDVYTTTEGYRSADPKKIKSFLTAGVRLITRDADAMGFIPLLDVLHHCAGEQVTHLLVEPGPTLASVFLAQNLADRVWIFRSPKTVNDPTAPSAVELPSDYIRTAQTALGPDSLTEYLNPRSDVYFAPEISTDYPVNAPATSR